VVVEGDEDLVDLVTGLVVGGSGGHHVEKLSEFDLSTAVTIELSDHLINSLGFGLDSQRIDGDLEFWMRVALPLGSMAPPRSRSKRSNAFLISVLIEGDVWADEVLEVE
jgi:hypothetical protein